MLVFMKKSDGGELSTLELVAHGKLHRLFVGALVHYNG
jgi:hypothetical protein